MIKNKGELVFLAVIAMGAVYFLVESFRFKVPGIGGKLGPGFWPQMILISLIVLCGYLIGGYLLQKRGAANEKARGFDLKEYRYLLVLALMIAYFLAMPQIGFILATPLFMAAFMLLLGEKSKGWIIGVSLGLTVVVVILFTKAMYVPLPRGKGIFLQFSHLFY